MVLRDKLLVKRGLNLIHPWFAFLYLLMALVLTMCTMNPILVMISFFSGIIYELKTIGGKRFSKKVPWLLLIVVITMIGNMCISHNGEHVLFLANDNRVTIEAGIYGLVFGLMFSSAFIWCSITERIITGEKLTYMFGSFAPNLGLVISMTLHYIPLIKRRFNIVHNAQVGMGRTIRSGAFRRVRQWGKEFSIVIAWSLENAIDTSEVMAAMGYGIGKRTSYSDYSFKTSDFSFLAAVIVLFLPAIFLAVSVKYKVYYYPTFGMFGDILNHIILSLCYFAFMLIPIFTERLLRWR